MADVLTVEQRRLNMSNIRGRDTKPEMVIRRGLHARGLRYRLQDRSLPGRPDLVFPKHRVVVLVHGCFWHGHTCPMFRLPGTRSEFWTAKIDANRARDVRASEALAVQGWRVLTIWECSMRGTARWPIENLLDASAAFIKGDAHQLEITGNWP